MNNPKYRLLRGVAENLIASMIGYYGFLSDISKLSITELHIDVLAEKMQPVTVEGLPAKFNVDHYHRWVVEQISNLGIPESEVEKVTVDVKVDKEYRSTEITACIRVANKDYIAEHKSTNHFV